MIKAEDIRQSLLDQENQEQAKILMRFFKTYKGGYGYGDCFLGLKNPQTRSVVKLCWKDTSIEEAEKLIKDKYHEVRLCGLLILVKKFEFAHKKKDENLMTEIYQKYISLHEYINNWDLVDLSCYRIVGIYCYEHPKEDTMYQWIKLEYSLWQNRISMVSLWWEISKGEFQNTLDRAKILMKSKEDLLHKAAGWMLREVYKKVSQEIIENFLEKNASNMPSIMLSYAVEKMEISQRHYYQKMRKPIK